MSNVQVHVIIHVSAEFGTESTERAQKQQCKDRLRAIRREKWDSNQEPIQVEGTWILFKLDSIAGTLECIIVPDCSTRSGSI